MVFYLLFVIGLFYSEISMLVNLLLKRYIENKDI
jgi:hypothetical protein